MRIRMQEGEMATLRPPHLDIGFVGKAVDERGNAALAFLRDTGATLKRMAYDPDTFTLAIDGEERDANDLEGYFEGLEGNSLVLEATTLGFAEVFLCSRVLRALGFPGLTLTYVEPAAYSNPRRSNLLQRREFDLSEQVPGFKAIPGATLLSTEYTEQRAVFFLGYEERRLDAALEDNQMLKPSSCSVVFGVPAFKAGWEMNAFANNIRVIRDKNVSGGLYFCGAENPAAAAGALEEIYDALGPTERLIVAPIGTKPNGVGAALFASVHPDVGILYDHPKRSPGRSGGVSTWHLFLVDFEAGA